MAQWRLRTAHYLSIPGTEWEYKETTREGRQGRQIFSVPMLLDPKDPSVCNRDGDCIVTDVAGYSGPNLWTFLGEPTPDMDPVDAEAKTISDSLSPKWQHPIESLPTHDFSASLIASLERQMREVVQTQAPAPPVSLDGVSKEEFAKLQEQVAALMARNAELESKAEPKAARRA